MMFGWYWWLAYLVTSRLKWLYLVCQHVCYIKGWALKEKRNVTELWRCECHAISRVNLQSHKKWLDGVKLNGELPRLESSPIHIWYTFTIFILGQLSSTLHWRHNDHDGVSNHQPHGCLLDRLFRRRSKKISKLRVTGLCVGNSPGLVNSPHKGPVTRKMFPFDDVIMTCCSFIISVCALKWTFFFEFKIKPYNLPH